MHCASSGKLSCQVRELKLNLQLQLAGQSVKEHQQRMPVLEFLEALSHRVPHSPYLILLTLAIIVLIKLLLPPRHKHTIAFTKAPSATDAERIAGLLLGTAVGDAKVRRLFLALSHLFDGPSLTSKARVLPLLE